MRHIRSTLAAVLLVAGGAVVASAQQPSAQQPSAAPAPQTQVQQGKARARRRAHRGMLGVNVRRALFKGITLSNAEKANLKQVRAKYAPQMKTLRAQLAPQLQAARQARQRGDTAALRQMWNNAGGERIQIRQTLESERNDLRGALTPANQAKFDANVKRFERRAAKRAMAWSQNGKHGAAARRGPVA